jgi:aldose sugar dehydrogenase
LTAMPRRDLAKCALGLLGLFALVPMLAPDAMGQKLNGAGIRVLGTRPPDQPPVLGQSLETREPIGIGQKPVFLGQTRAVAVATKTPIQVDVISHGLAHPWSFAFLPDGNILITEKVGKLRIVARDGKIGPPLTGVPAVVYRGDAGLLDVALDPQFMKSRLIYFTYVEPREGGSGVAVAKAKLSSDGSALEAMQIILHADPPARPTAHYGSRLLFDKQGFLFVSLGERFFDPTRAAAQSLDSYMGKILRIKTDGTPAPGNPFEHTAGALPAIWSYGHRNPQGLFFNPVTGDLWNTEHGPQGGDEINLIKPGQNYGWPVIAYGLNYEGTPVGDGAQAKLGMEQPLYYWDPAIAPSGASFYTGNLIAEWKNNLFVAALAGQHVSRLVLKGNHVVGEERLLLDQHQRMRDVQQGPDGALWVITDDDDGRLLRISPSNH